VASVPIRSTAVVAAPKDYPIPPSQEIILQSVRASFLDNGAGGDWVPALQILDNNGNVLVTAADKGVTVTAGSDADVSWFPGVKVAGGASTAALSYAWGWRDNASGDPNIFLAAGASINIPFLHATTTNASVMSWSTVANPNDRLILGAAGLYAIFWSGNMTLDPTYAFYLISSSGDQLQHSAIVASGIAGGSTPQRGISSQQDYSIFNVASSATLRAYTQNNTSATQTVFANYLSAIYLGVPA
jgi:hypothetical protein